MSSVAAVNAATMTAIIASQQEALKKRAALYLMLKKINQNKEEKSMALPIMIKDLVGKDVKITTLTASYRGRVAEIQDNWIKVVFKNGKEFFVKEDMILGIKTL